MAKMFDTASGPMLTSPVHAHALTRGSLIVEPDEDLNRLIIVFGGHTDADGFCITGHDGIDTVELRTDANALHHLVIGGSTARA